MIEKRIIKNLYLFIHPWMLLNIFLVACVGVTNSKPTPTLVAATKIVEFLPTSYKQGCQSINFSPTPGPDVASLFPTINNSDHIRGGAAAGVTIVEYGDFQCPGCAALAPVLLKLNETFPLDLRVAFRQLPLFDIHDKALSAAKASEAASDEGKFWEMHDFLYENYELWISMEPEKFNIWLIDQAGAIGLNRVNFQNSFNSQEINDRVKYSLENALKIGLRSTPFLLINGQIYNGPSDYNSLEKIIKLISLGNRQFTNCPDMSIDPLRQYIAILHSEKGDIVIQLYADKAPYTVNSFIFLAKKGWYDNITFHKVNQGIVQTGDPSGTGLGGPGYYFDNEYNPSLKFNQPGVVAMMNSGLDTNGSQFFITTGSQEELNGLYTIFGQVISGMDVITKLTPRNPEEDSISTPGDLLIKVTVVEK